MESHKYGGILNPLSCKNESFACTLHTWCDKSDKHPLPILRDVIHKQPLRAAPFYCHYKGGLRLYPECINPNHVEFPLAITLTHSHSRRVYPGWSA